MTLTAYAWARDVHRVTNTRTFPNPGTAEAWARRLLAKGNHKYVRIFDTDNTLLWEVHPDE